MQAVHNLCKVSKERQSEAAGAGVTQALSKLYSAQPGPGGARRAPAPTSPAAAETSAKLRGLCISLLCALVHSNAKTRAELWQCQGLELFIDLLSEQEWQRQALDALAVWLQEDTPRIEPKLLVKRNVQVVAAMFRAQDRIQERLLRPLKEMLQCSPKLSAAFGTQVHNPVGLSLFCAPCCYCHTRVTCVGCVSQHVLQHLRHAYGSNAPAVYQAAVSPLRQTGKNVERRNKLRNKFPY